MVSGVSELTGPIGGAVGSSDDDGPRPDVISYNTVLAAWSKSAGVRPGESPSAGEGGAQKRTAPLSGNSPRTRRCDFWTRSKADTCNRSRAKPTVVPSRSNRTSSRITQPSPHSRMPRSTARMERQTPTARKAEEILSRMIESGIEPDAYSYNGVLLAWARSSGGLPAARHAETILRSMKEPTIVSWSTVVTA